MIVRINQDDPDFGLTEGELYRAERYWLDPLEKFTLLSRIPDGWNPACNVYTHQVERVQESENPNEDHARLVRRPVGPVEVAK